MRDVIDVLKKSYITSINENLEKWGPASLEHCVTRLKQPMPAPKGQRPRVILPPHTNPLDRVHDATSHHSILPHPYCCGVASRADVRKDPNGRSLPVRLDR